MVALTCDRGNIKPLTAIPPLPTFPWLLAHLLGGVQMLLSVLSIAIHMVDLDLLRGKDLSWYSPYCMLLLASSFMFMMCWIHCGIICCSTGSRCEMVIRMVLSIIVGATSVAFGIGGAYNTRHMYEIGKQGMSHMDHDGYRPVNSQETNYITNKRFNNDMFCIQIIIAFLHAGLSAAYVLMTYHHTRKVQKEKITWKINTPI